MRRFFARALPAIGETLVLDAEVSEHVHVLRLQIDDRVVLFDGDGEEAVARIVSTAEQCRVRIESKSRRDADAKRVVLVQCLPKGDKGESIVRMATELGVSAIVFVHSDHAVVQWDPSRVASKLERLARVASEAARQSERSTVPSVDFGGALSSEWARANSQTRWIVPTPRVTADPIASVRALSTQCDEVRVVIGPEGGLSVNEQNALEKHGAVPVSLGDHVLRVETAAPVAIALVRAAMSGQR